MTKTNWRYGVYEINDYGRPVEPEDWFLEGRYGLCIYSTPESTSPTAFCGLLFRTSEEAQEWCDKENFQHDNSYQTHKSNGNIPLTKLIRVVS
jgi:hypothetical protein